MTQEALKLALEALTYIYTETTADEDELIDQAITAIKEALEQTQEPFAYVNVEKRRLEFASLYVKWDTPTTIKLDKIPLYTIPPQSTWVGLTDEEMTHTNHHMVEGAYQYSFKQGALWAEAKLKELNT